MNDKKPQFLFGQLREKTDRNGNTFFIGNFGMGVTLTLFKHKTKDGVWNMFLSEREMRDDRPKQETEDDSSPF